MPPKTATALEKMAASVGGCVIVALLVWIASSVASLKESAAVFVEWKESKDRQDEKQDRQIEELRRGR